MNYRTMILICLGLYMATVSMAVAKSPDAELKPEIMLSTANRGNAYKGWPVILRVTLALPIAPADDSKLMIAPKDTPWTTAIKLTVKDTAGIVKDWPLHLISAKNPTLELTRGTEAKISYWLSSEETLKLAEGKYIITASLEVKEVASVSAWAGMVTSDEIPIRISAEPAPLTAEQTQSKILIQARLAVLLGDFPGALTLIDGLLKNKPDNILWLSVKASILEDMGKPEEAIKANNYALAIFLQEFPDEDPPGPMIETQRRLIMALMRTK